MIGKVGPKKVAFALVSIGGNDASFGQIGTTCAGPGDCSEIGQRWLTALGAVEPKIDVAYAKIRDATEGKVPVIVVPYPIPISEKKCSWSILGEEEHRFLFGFVNELNRVVKSAATRAGFYYMDTIESSLQRKKLRICDGRPGDLGVNFVAANPQSGAIEDTLNPRNWLHNSFHPNARGHRAMFAAAEQWFDDHPVLTPPAPKGGARYVVRSLDDVAGKPRIERCGRERLAYCRLAPGKWQLAQARRFLRLVLAPLLLALIASWLLVMPFIQWATQNNFTTFKLLSRLWHRPHL